MTRDRRWAAVDYELGGRYREAHFYAEKTLQAATKRAEQCRSRDAVAVAICEVAGDSERRLIVEAEAHCPVTVRLAGPFVLGRFGKSEPFWRQSSGHWSISTSNEMDYTLRTVG